MRVRSTRLCCVPGAIAGKTRESLWMNSLLPVSLRTVSAPPAHRRLLGLQRSNMDSARFDSLTRSLTAHTTRRGALAALLGGTLGLLGLTEAPAKKGKHHRKKKPPQSPPAPTCSDGIQNGNETGVDCGGSCPRCANGMSCLSRNDCTSALCSGRVCGSCANRFDCGTGANGEGCFCSSPVGGGPTVCHEGAAAKLGVTNCDECPADTVCVADVFPPHGLLCFKHCGAT